MPDAIDDDTAAAVIAAWQADKALATLTALPPQRGRLKSQEPPYVELAVTMERREMAASGSPPTWFDFRKVTLTVVGLEPDVRKIVGQLRGDGVAQGTFTHGLLLKYPSGAFCMGIIPYADAAVEQEETNKAGAEQWKGIVAFVAESVRIG